MIDAMKSVTPNSLIQPFIGSRVRVRGLWHCAMKASIEYRHLLDFPDQTLNDPNPLEFGPVVERRKSSHAGNHALDFRRYDRGFNELLAPMHNAMAHHINRRGILPDGVRAVPKSAQHVLHCTASVGGRYGFFSR